MFCKISIFSFVGFVCIARTGFILPLFFSHPHNTGERERMLAIYAVIARPPSLNVPLQMLHVCKGSLLELHNIHSQLLRPQVYKVGIESSCQTFFC